MLFRRKNNAPEAPERISMTMNGSVLFIELVLRTKTNVSNQIFPDYKLSAAFTEHQAYIVHIHTVHMLQY